MVICVVGSKLQETIILYCKKFGSKSCCYSDISGYFSKLLVGQSVDAILESVREALDLQSNNQETHYSSVSRRNGLDLMYHLFSPIAFYCR